MVKTNKRAPTLFKHRGIVWRRWCAIPSTAKTRRVAHELREITVAEFLYKERQLWGFENPTRALYQTIREYVENALDATDLYGILPNITVIVETDPNDRSICTVMVEDNGIGIPPQKIAEALGKPLVTSKFVIRQSRGQFGLGAKAVTIYALSTTGSPVEAYSSPIDSNRMYYVKFSTDLTKNEPVIYALGSWKLDIDWHGTRIKARIKCNWPYARARILKYFEMLAIVTPYADIVFIDPDGVIHHYPRITTKMPRPPKEVKPHPASIERGELQRLLETTTAQTLKEFLVTTFQRVGEKSALAVLKMAGLDPNRSPKSLTPEEIDRLHKALRSYKFLAPSSDPLAPIGEELIEQGLRAVLKPEFVTAVTRRPKIHREGHPFIVEVGIAYGGQIEPSEKPILLRYANRIPLLYDEKADVAWKVLEEFNWQRYEVKFPAPLVVLTHICSTKIPWKTGSKEAVAEVEEIADELRLALQEAARRLRQYLVEKKREEELREKISTFLRYIPEVADSLATILADNGVSPEEVKKMLIDALRRRMQGKELKILEEQVKNLSKIKIESGG